MQNIKNKIILVFIIAIIFFIPKNLLADNNLEGFWEESKKSSLQRGDKSYLKIEFKKDKKCEIFIIKTDGTPSSYFGGNYDFDSTKKPMPLSIRNISNLAHPLHTIIRYIDKNTIDIMEFSTTQRFRPVSFSKEKKIRLERIKISEEKKIRLDKIKFGNS